MIIGLTGGIGSGKSTVAALFKANGYDIIDADEISKEVTAKGSPVLSKLAGVFGDDIIHGDGSLDRKLLRERAFSSEDGPKVLNEIVTSRIIEISKERFTEKCVYDAPTLLENGLQSIVDKVIVVTAPKKVRIKRVMERDGVSRQAVIKIMDNQMPEKEKVKYADFVIKNNGDNDSLKESVNKVLDVLK